MKLRVRTGKAAPGKGIRQEIHPPCSGSPIRFSPELCRRIQPAVPQRPHAESTLTLPRFCPGESLGTPQGSPKLWVATPSLYCPPFPCNAAKVKCCHLGSATRQRKEREGNLPAGNRPVTSDPLVVAASNSFTSTPAFMYRDLLYRVSHIDATPPCSKN